LSREATNRAESFFSQMRRTEIDKDKQCGGPPPYGERRSGKAPRGRRFPKDIRTAFWPGAFAEIVNGTQNVSTRRGNPPQTDIVHAANSRSVLLCVKNAPELDRSVPSCRTACNCVWVRQSIPDRSQKRLSAVDSNFHYANYDPRARPAKLG
jgi:hypothetical protein